MADFLGNLVGNDGIAKIAGEKAGDMVEGMVNKFLSGNEENGEKKGEQKDDNKGGLDVGDALSFMSGKKDEQEGLDVKNVLGGFLK